MSSCQRLATSEFQGVVEGKLFSESEWPGDKDVAQPDSWPSCGAYPGASIRAAAGEVELKALLPGA